MSERGISSNWCVPQHRCSRDQKKTKGNFSLFIDSSCFLTVKPGNYYSFPVSIEVLKQSSNMTCDQMPKYTGVSALASFLPKNTQGWSPSEWTGWISLSIGIKNWHQVQKDRPTPVVRGSPLARTGNLLGPCASHWKCSSPGAWSLSQGGHGKAYSGGQAWSSHTASLTDGTLRK